MNTRAEVGSATGGGRPRGTRRALALGLLLVAAAVLAWSFLPLEDWIYAFREWIHGFGPRGVAVLAAVLFVGTLAMAPASTLYLVAGLLYGIGWGLAIAFGSAIAGAAAAFLLARTLLRRRVEALIERHPKLKALDHAIRDASLRVVLLLRLAPLVPGNVHNYAFGVSRIPFHHFLLAATVGMAPWVVLFTGLGSAGGFYLARQELEFGVWQWAMLGGGVALLCLVVWLIARKARAQLEAMGVRAGDD